MAKKPFLDDRSSRKIMELAMDQQAEIESNENPIVVATSNNPSMLAREVKDLSSDEDEMSEDLTLDHDVSEREVYDELVCSMVALSVNEAQSQHHKF
jgi:hypothetical protein